MSKGIPKLVNADWTGAALVLYSPPGIVHCSRGNAIMATGPVCYMVVDEDEARARSSYKGQEYFFCSDFCRKKFEENPARYVKLARSMDIGPNITC